MVIDVPGEAPSRLRKTASQMPTQGVESGWADITKSKHALSLAKGHWFLAGGGRRTVGEPAQRLRHRGLVFSDRKLMLAIVAR